MSNWYDKYKLRPTSGRSKKAGFLRHGDPYHPGKGRQRCGDQNENEVKSSQKKLSTIFHFRDRTTMGDVFHLYAQEMTDQLIRLVEGMGDMDLEVRESPDLGFRFTEYSHDEKSIIFFVDVSLRLAPDYINLDIKGAKEDLNFSDTLRLFMTDSIRQTVRRVASVVRLHR